MNIPKVIFRKMTLEENIDLLKWQVNDDNNALDIKKYVLNYFPQINNKNIREVVTIYYQEHEKEIDENIKYYDKVWSNYNNIYMNQISAYLNANWPVINYIEVNVGFIPIFPRYLDDFSFSIGVNLDEKNLVRICAHELLHFLWFIKWRELYPNSKKEEYDSPYLTWQYSEMVTDPVLNSKEINNILHVKEKAYDSFYKLDGGKVMSNLKKIYLENISIEEKICKGYSYIEIYMEK